MPIRPPLTSPLGPALSRLFDAGPPYVPVPPTPPLTPLDLTISADDGLVSFSQPVTISSPVLVLRVGVRNNAVGLPGMSWALDGVPFTRAGTEIGDATIGGPVSALYAIRGLSNGVKTLTCTCTGSAGRGQVRLGPLLALDPAMFGAIASAVTTSNYMDINITPQNAGSDISQQGTWIDDRAYPITQYSGAVTQFQGVTASLGPELFLNGDFATDTVWVKGGSWVISGGVATRSLATGGTIISQPVAGVLLTRYQLSFDITAINGGTLQPYWQTSAGWSAASGTIAAAGSYRLPITGNTAYTGLGWQGVANTPPGVSIDNASLKQVNGGMTSWFGRQPAVNTTSRQYTIEASILSKCTGLIVELLGAVVP